MVLKFEIKLEADHMRRIISPIIMSKSLTVCMTEFSCCDDEMSILKGTIQKW